MLQIVVVGGGAAGFFGALAAKSANPQASVKIIEKTAQLLSKVRISGGGRCNVTHHCFDPKLLVQHYPRGNKELLGPFTTFQPRDTINWFESRGVALKTEGDGRVFPTSDSSSSIIHCLLDEAKKLGVEVITQQKIEGIEKKGLQFHLCFSSGEILKADRLLLATGSSPQGYAWANFFGHSVQDPVPSLFTFNIPNSPLEDLAGIAVEQATLSLASHHLQQTGPLMITHWGFSGPVALKLSAWGARLLHQLKYQTPLKIDWLPALSREEVVQIMETVKRELPRDLLYQVKMFSLPKNLWKRLIDLSPIERTKRLSELSRSTFNLLADRLKADLYQVSGKTTYKEEFVTCGGVALSEVNFKEMQSRICPGLFFAGEILDIDGVTGGFNFQNGWTTGWIAGRTMAKLNA